MDYAIIILNVIFLDECCEGAEYDLHIQSETVGLPIGDVELLAFLSRHHTSFSSLFNVPQTSKTGGRHEAVNAGVYG